MINAFYASKSGVKNYQYCLDAIANNIANSRTDSYKAQVISFTDLLYTNIQSADGEPQNLQTGNGSRILIFRDMTQGIITTGENGIMINGNGYYAVENQNGETLYTKKGDFSVRDIDGADYLVTENGDFVLDPELNRIIVNGDEFFNLAAPGESLEGSMVLGIFKVTDSNDLISVGNGRYTISPDTTVTPELDTESKLIYDMNESSNVNLITEMSKMIIAQRGFQLNSQMLKTADELESYANNLRN
ncbi:MAG: hypothetical protein A2Y17_04290 [Clostridiales bacterium GWF2_38_85]|nr:MAG: hypothetical protein A2Y17_04290 [Clostridiales bacterium GWF2_38_85]HBL83429.1 hypothetical protein [Clostridiales bacterium]